METLKAGIHTPERTAKELDYFSALFPRVSDASFGNDMTDKLLYKITTTKAAYIFLPNSDTDNEEQEHISMYALEAWSGDEIESQEYKLTREQVISKLKSL